MWGPQHGGSTADPKVMGTTALRLTPSLQSAQKQTQQRTGGHPVPPAAGIQYAQVRRDPRPRMQACTGSHLPRHRLRLGRPHPHRHAAADFAWPAPQRTGKPMRLLGAPGMQAYQDFPASRPLICIPRLVRGHLFVPDRAPVGKDGGPGGPWGRSPVGSSDIHTWCMAGLPRFPARWQASTPSGAAHPTIPKSHARGHQPRPHSLGKWDRTSGI